MEIDRKIARNPANLQSCGACRNAQGINQKRRTMPHGRLGHRKVTIQSEFCNSGELCVFRAGDRIQMLVHMRDLSTCLTTQIKGWNALADHGPNVVGLDDSTGFMLARSNS
jgi:hypothetical protein